MADVKFEVVEHVAVISDKGSGWTREINLVKWNDGGIKVDIRDWKNNRESMRKGITLNRQEFLTLVKNLKKIDASVISEYSPAATADTLKEGPKVVEFSDGSIPLAANG